MLSPRLANRLDSLSILVADGTAWQWPRGDSPASIGRIPRQIFVAQLGILDLAGVRLVMELVSHLHHVLDQVESSAEFLKTSEGQAVEVELTGLLRALEAE